MKRFIAILEDDQARLQAMRRCIESLTAPCKVISFDRAGEMIRWLDDHLDQVVLISLDHDLPLAIGPDRAVDDYGTGRMVAEWLATKPPTCPVIVHTSNENFAPGMMWVLEGGGWTHFRVYPHDDCGWIASAWKEVVAQRLGSPNRNEPPPTEAC